MTQIKNEPESFRVAQNATTHSENTPRLSDFRGKFLKLAFELRNRGYSKAYPGTLIRAPNLRQMRREKRLDVPY
jgi:hypothetical protein